MQSATAVLFHSHISFYYLFSRSAESLSRPTACRPFCRATQRGNTVQTIERSEEHGIVPAADTDTQDSVRARRRRCAEPSRVGLPPPHSILSPCQAFRTRERTVFGRFFFRLFLLCLCRNITGFPCCIPAFRGMGIQWARAWKRFALWSARSILVASPAFPKWNQIRRAPVVHRERPCLSFSWQYRGKIELVTVSREDRARDGTLDRLVVYVSSRFVSLAFLGALAQTHRRLLKYHASH